MQTDCFELANMCRASHPAVTVAAQRVLALAAPRPDLDAQHAREFDDEMCLVEWSVCGCELRLAPTNEALELGMVRKQEVRWDNTARRLCLSVLRRWREYHAP